MTQLNIFLLGAPRIIWNEETLDIRSRRAIALLAYLACQPQEHAVNRNFLADLLWSSNNNNRSRLRRTLYDLKDLGADDWLLVTRSSVMLNPDVEIIIDVQDFCGRFEDDITQVSYNNLREAVHAYQDIFLQGFSLEEAPNYSAWMQAERQTLHSQYLMALEQLTYKARDAGDTQEAIHYVQQLLQQDPLREAMHRTLMRLYVQQKQREAAMQQYHHLVRLLRDELNEMPQPATRQLYDDLLRLETKPEDTDPLVAKRIASQNLFPSVPDDLIGRDEDNNNLYATLLSDKQSIAIIGLPGVGKSALVASVVNNPYLHVIFPDGVLWVTLGKNPDIPEKLNTWCDTLNITPADSIENTHMKLQGALQGKKTLIVIDDIRSEDDAQPFRLTNSTTKVIYTTRFQSLARSLIGTQGEIYHLQPLTEEESLNRLSQFCSEAVETRHDDILNVLRRIHGIPVALNLFGQMIKGEWEFGLLDEFFAQMTDLHHLLSLVLPANILDASSDQGYTIQKRFLANISTDLHDRFRRLLAPLTESIMAQRTLTTDELMACWGEQEPRQAIHQLVDNGVFYIVGAGQFVVHPIWLDIFQISQ